MLERLHSFHREREESSMHGVQHAAVTNGNVFEALMEACKTCSLGQLTKALFDVGGQYRRNM
jgi:methylmalonyl-CoA mutase